MLAAALASSVQSDAAELRGKVQLFDHGKDKTPGEIASTVVYFTPDRRTPAPPLAQPAEVVTVRKEFSPRVSVVPQGSMVRFPNQDPILHNVFSVSGNNRFDLGLYGRGQAESATLRHPGVVRVFCNVHHSMVAYVLVLDTPFFTTPDPQGSFVLRDLPVGKGTLTVWHERSEPATQTLEVPSTQPLVVRLELTKPRVPPHQNKLGKPYERKRGSAYN